MLNHRSTGGFETTLPYLRFIYQKMGALGLRQLNLDILAL